MFELYHYAPRPLPEAFPITGKKYIYFGTDPYSVFHLHNVLELGYCHEGRGVFITLNKVLPFETGDILVVNNREPHMAYNIENKRSVWTWIKADPLRLCASYVEDPTFIDPSSLCGPQFNNIITKYTNPIVVSMVKRLVRELDKKLPEYQSYVRMSIACIGIELHRKNPFQNETLLNGQSGSSLLHRINPALQILREDIAKHHSGKFLAEQCYMSETNFRRTFYKALGMNVTQYVQKMRIITALSLLRQPENSIADIAHAVGYSECAAFDKLFKKHMKMSPTEFRTLHMHQ